MTTGPYDRLGTKCASITSRCSSRAPADSSISTSRCRLAKSHFSIEGAMSGVALRSLCRTKCPVIEMPDCLSGIDAASECRPGSSPYCDAFPAGRPPKPVRVRRFPTGIIATCCAIMGCATSVGLSMRSLQPGDLADQVRGAARITVLIVVPSQNLDHVPAYDARPAGVEDATVGVPDHVAGNDGILVVFKDSLQRTLRGGFDR